MVLSPINVNINHVKTALLWEIYWIGLQFMGFFALTLPVTMHNQTSPLKPGCLKIELTSFSLGHLYFSKEQNLRKLEESGKRIGSRGGRGMSP